MRKGQLQPATPATPDVIASNRFQRRSTSIFFFFLGGLLWLFLGFYGDWREEPRTNSFKNQHEGFFLFAAVWQRWECPPISTNGSGSGSGRFPRIPIFPPPRRLIRGNDGSSLSQNPGATLGFWLAQIPIGATWWSIMLRIDSVTVSIPISRHQLLINSSKKAGKWSAKKGMSNLDFFCVKNPVAVDVFS